MSGIAEAISKMGPGKRNGIADHMSGDSDDDSKAQQSEHDEDGPETHLKALHAKHGGKHMLVHAHEGGLTSHHVKDDGQVEGPHDHQNAEELKQHLDRFLSEEAHEPASDHDDGLM